MSRLALGWPPSHSRDLCKPKNKATGQSTGRATGDSQPAPKADRTRHLSPCATEPFDPRAASGRLLLEGSHHPARGDYGKIVPAWHGWHEPCGTFWPIVIRRVIRGAPFWGSLLDGYND